jgi:hypothetical protein
MSKTHLLVRCPAHIPVTFLKMYFNFKFAKYTYEVASFQKNVSDIQENTEFQRAINIDPACNTNLGNTCVHAYRYSATSIL